MSLQGKQPKQWARIVAKAWADEDFKQNLLADPAAVLRAEGLEVPAGMQVNCVESSASTVWLVLPAKPAEATASEEMEERLAALF